jgi:hypothetical protein
MFSFFKSKKKQSARIVDPGPSAVNRMTLDERKAYRQEMLYQSIRETFFVHGGCVQYVQVQSDAGG